MLATPCYTGYLHYAHAESVARTQATPASTGIRFERWVAPGNPVLPRVRNVLCAHMLSPQPDGVDFDGILFIDDDIAFKPEDAVRMVSHGEKIVAGVAQKRAPNTNAPAEINAALDHNLEVDERGLASNTFIPSCFMWIHRSVFEGMLNNEELHDSGLVRRFIYPKLPDAAMPFCATYFGYGLAAAPENGPEAKRAAALGIEDAMVDVGEDYDFSIKCDVLGVPRYIDTAVELIHYDGRVAHDLSFRKMLQTGAIKVDNGSQAA